MKLLAHLLCTTHTVLCTTHTALSLHTPSCTLHTPRCALHTPRCAHSRHVLYTTHTVTQQAYVHYTRRAVRYTRSYTTGMTHGTDMHAVQHRLIGRHIQLLRISLRNSEYFRKYCTHAKIIVYNCRNLINLTILWGNLFNKAPI